jgi:phosphate starvation-inducible protein PhoH
MSNNNTFELKKIKPLNKYQAAALDTSKHLVLHGAAGTGKTLILLYKALRMLETKKIKQIVILRSAVATRDIGFLPGKLENKIKVFEEPYENIVDFLYDRPKAYLAKKRLGEIDFRVTSFTRGVTFEDTFVLVDEFQNMSEHELHSLMTRLGQHSVIAFSGDVDQTDLKNQSIGNFLKILSTMPEDFDLIEFDVEYVVRSRIVKQYLKKRKEFYAQGNSSQPDLPRQQSGLGDTPP